MSDPEDPGGAGSAGVRGDHLPTIAVADEQTLAVDGALLERAARAALAGAGTPAFVELSIALVTEEAIAALKGRYEGAETPTDVLSFPMDGRHGPILGDVVICPEIARRHARAIGATMDREIAQLVVHGVLHLAGRDHGSPTEEIAMRREERRILTGIR